ncbi:MAG TPA: YicC/YloC family endoribonuclease, partial [Holophagaceae bacterium]|nr:YicC/YloC family endoribonuclease [Holophagaceae bacterium]
MRSMTAYAELIRPLGTGRLRLSLRSVNGKGLDLSIRLHPALFPLEAALRTKVLGAAKRGKLDLAVELQDAPELEPRVNRALLRSLAKTWQEDAEWLALPPMTADAFFRVPGAFLPPESDLAERAEAPLLEALEALLADWNAKRVSEAERLRPFFSEVLQRLRALHAALRAEAEAQAAELPALYAARLEQILRDATLEGQLAAERLIGEAGALAERQDVREELVRLEAHFD